MRDSNPGKLRTVRTLSATASLVLALAGCNSPAYLALTAQQDALGDSSSGDAMATSVSTGEVGEVSTSDTAEPGSGSSDAADVTGLVASSGDTGASATTGGETSDTEAPAVLPSIVSVTVPAKVYAAGRVPVEVQTMHTTTMRVSLDGAEIGELADEGGGLFVGSVPVRGAIDNGSHQVTVIAQQGPFEVEDGAGYEVSTPKPGTMAWFQAGPAGSRTNRIALAADGGVLEAGRVEINKVTRPGLRKRSGLTGAELWSVTLDTREGEIADLAALPDGRVWVAMNVRKPGNLSPQPRIALFDAAGVFTGIEAFGDIGQGVRGIAADADGGCFAVGFASAGYDLDIGFWRVDDAGMQTLGETWDYVPVDAKKHSFTEFAMDVVMDGDVAWVVGASDGKHEQNAIETRGILVPMNLHTGELVAPVIVAPKSDPYTQSAFFGAGLHPLGVLVTGYGCDDACADYRIETSLYELTGLRLWHSVGAAGAGKRYGSDVVVDSQGRAIVSGALTDKGVLRGYIFAHHVGGEEVLPLFEHWFPVSAASEALGVLVDAYDRLFGGGYITTNGATQGRLILLHP